MYFSFLDSPITLMLLIINVIVSGYALYSQPSLIDRLGFQPVRVREQGEYFRYITAGFVHAGIWHLAFNMYVLYIFGPVLEAQLGSLDFILLYFGAELAAHALTYWHQRDNPVYNAVGASGAISGVVFAFCMFFPFQQLSIIFVPGISFPAILFAVVYVVGSIYAMKMAKKKGKVGGIAHEAHLGGALGGVLLTILLEPDVIQIFIGQLQRYFG